MIKILFTMYVKQYINVLGDEIKSFSFLSNPIYDVCNYCICMYLFKK